MLNLLFIKPKYTLECFQPYSDATEEGLTNKIKIQFCLEYFEVIRDSEKVNTINIQFSAENF